MSLKNSDLLQKFKFKPNKIGWLFVVGVGFLFSKYVKVILYQTFELFDFYPESTLWTWLCNLIGFLTSFLILSYQMENLYGKKNI